LHAARGAELGRQRSRTAYLAGGDAVGALADGGATGPLGVAPVVAGPVAAGEDGAAEERDGLVPVDVDCDGDALGDSLEAEVDGDADGVGVLRLTVRSVTTDRVVPAVSSGSGRTKK
jgi:hypothetical protein